MPRFLPCVLLVTLGRAAQLVALTKVVARVPGLAAFGIASILHPDIHSWGLFREAFGTQLAAAEAQQAFSRGSAQNQRSHDDWTPQR